MSHTARIEEAERRVKELEKVVKTQKAEITKLHIVHADRRDVHKQVRRNRLRISVRTTFDMMHPLPNHKVFTVPLSVDGVQP